MPKNSGDPPVRATQSSGRTARAERAATARAERERKTKRAKVRNLGAIGLMVVLVAVVAVVLARDHGPAASATATKPPGFSAGQGIAAGSGPVDITTYEDFQCPACKMLEDTSGADLAKLEAAGGGATVHYVPVSILDRSSSTQYSTRSANAAYCAPEDKFKAFHDKLYANQPEEGGSGLTDDKIISLAGEAGITGHSFADCVRGQMYADFVRAQTDAFSNALQKAGSSGVATPGVFVDGSWIQQQWQTPGFFPAIVAQEAARKTASPSASASASVG